MKRLQRAAILLELIQSLHNNDSWAGETHIQKAMYCLQELTGVPHEFDFILYKHGPFSFDLRDELNAMRADGLLEMRIIAYPYGPSLFRTEMGKAICERHPKTLERHGNEIAYIAKALGKKKVAELERLATALFVTRETGSGDVNQRASRLCELKPHILPPQAMDAVNAVDGLLAVAIPDSPRVS